MGSRSYIFNILHKDLHKKLHKEPLLPMSLILFAVILAYSFRLIGRGSFYPTLFSYLRSFIYIGLYAAGTVSGIRVMTSTLFWEITETTAVTAVWRMLAIYTRKTSSAGLYSDLQAVLAR